MNQYSTSGRVISRTPIERGVSKSNRAWQKCTVVLQESSKTDRLVAITCFGDEMVELAKGLKRDDAVTIYFNLQSRHYEGKWYTSALAYRIESSADRNEVLMQVTSGGRASFPSQAGSPMSAPVGQESQSAPLQRQETIKQNSGIISESDIPF